MFNKGLIFSFLLIALAFLGIWVFWKIVVYIVIALILFLIGHPLFKRIKKISIKGKTLNNAFSSLITLLILIAIICCFFALIFPPLAKEVMLLSKLNFYDVAENIINQFPSIKSILNKPGNEDALKGVFNAQLKSLFDFETLTEVVNNLFVYIGSITGGAFCVIFISFFFLKNETLIGNSILLLTPQKYDKEIQEILKTSKVMLSKYFIGLLIDLCIVGSLAGFSLWLLGIKNAFIIGFMAGMFNLIPYLGPLITMLFALFLGVSGCIEAGQYDLIATTIVKIITTLLSINLLDATFLQPYIFSNTVKAHPLEIFLITLMAGTLAGIPGMIVAMPCYTLIRIIAKEFLIKFKFFRKLTETISD